MRWPQCIALTLLCFSCGKEKKQPNVILITLDTVRADYLTCYGSQKTHTPALDRLAEEGVRFEQARSVSGVTPVSHASILTGRMPYEHGLRVMAGNGGFSLPPDPMGMAKAFQEAGYQTAAVQSAFPVSRTFGLQHGFDSFQDIRGEFKDTQSGIAGWNLYDLQRRSDTTTNMALEAIDDCEGPFFIWIHYWDPHDEGLMPPETFMAEQPTLPDLKTHNNQFRDALYGLEISYQDTQIARLFEGLESRGLWNNTVIAATADHGEGLLDGFADHSWFYHRMHYEEQLHVPLLLKGPGVAKGVVSRASVSNADIAPTVMSLAGLPPLHGTGPSLEALWQDSAGANHRNWYAEQLNAYDHNAGLVYRRPDAAFLHTVGDGSWKLTYRPHLPIQFSELYNLKNDPKESVNRIGSAPHVFRRLAEDLAARNPWAMEPFEGEAMDASSSEALSSIGYGHLEPTLEMRWWWHCPLHPKVEAPSRGRCSIDGCGFPLLPRNDWKAPKRK